MPKHEGKRMRLKRIMKGNELQKHIWNAYLQKHEEKGMRVKGIRKGNELQK
jgi:hypothetical protein